MSPLPAALVLTSTLLHAGWNLLAHARRGDPALLWRAYVVTGLVGLPLVLTAVVRGEIPGAVLGLVALSGLTMATYSTGLTAGYRSGDFTVVYPVARALPVLLLGLFDVARGRAPSPLGWLGMGLVTLGCMIAPLRSLREIRLERYLNRTGLWVSVTALGTLGYSGLDKIAQEMMPPGPGSALRYILLQALFTAPWLYLSLRLVAKVPVSPGDAPRWRWGAVAGLFITGAYGLILWAYQLVPQVSYVVAFRQLSIVWGVLLGSWLFQEPARNLRLAAAGAIACGVVLTGWPR